MRLRDQLSQELVRNHRHQKTNLEPEVSNPPSPPPPPQFPGGPWLSSFQLLEVEDDPRDLLRLSSSCSWNQQNHFEFLQLQKTWSSYNFTFCDFSTERVQGIWEYLYTCILSVLEQRNLLSKLIQQAK